MLAPVSVDRFFNGLSGSVAWRSWESEHPANSNDVGLGTVRNILEHCWLVRFCCYDVGVGIVRKSILDCIYLGMPPFFLGRRGLLHDEIWNLQLRCIVGLVNIKSCLN